MVRKNNKIIPLRKPEKEFSFEERVEKFEEYSKDPEQCHKIFSELGFTYVEDGCDGFCPECEQKDTCQVYPELKDEWEQVLLKEKRALQADKL